MLIILEVHVLCLFETPLGFGDPSNVQAQGHFSCLELFQAQSLDTNAVKYSTAARQMFRMGS